MKINIIADMSVHTVSDAAGLSTVKENAEIAKMRGMRCIAITDHATGIMGAPAQRHYDVIRKYGPKNIDGVDILYGIEMHMMGLKELDLDKDAEKIIDTDWTLVGYHPNFISRNIQTDATTLTRAYCQLLDSPYLMVLSHPDRFGCVFDYEKVASEFRERGRLIELNNASLVYGNEDVRKSSYALMSACKKNGAPIVVSSGAHYCGEVGDFALSVELLESLNFPQDLILNVDYDRIKEYLRKYQEWKKSEIAKQELGAYKQNFDRSAFFSTRNSGAFRN